ncbi:MAG: glutaredoxin family protein [Massilia sp.]
MPGQGPRFTLYGRAWCHLCDDMLAALQALAPPGKMFEVDVIDIDEAGIDPALLERFDELVPVLFGADLAAPELCHYFLDVAAVQAYLAGGEPAGAAA